MKTIYCNPNREGMPMPNKLPKEATTVIVGGLSVQEMTKKKHAKGKIDRGMGKTWDY